MISKLYINIKKWLQLYGHEVLDLVIQVDHEDEKDPRKRYERFDEQFNSHVGTTAHIEHNQGWEQPYLAIDIVPEPLSRGCFKKYIVNFTLYYSAVSPVAGRRCVENTPEGKLEYRDEAYKKLTHMICHQVQTGNGLKNRTFAEDVAQDPDWYLPIKVQPVHWGEVSDFLNEGTDEVEQFTFPVTLSVYEC